MNPQDITPRLRIDRARLKRGEVASTTRELLDQWFDNELRKVDEDAKVAVGDGKIGDRALELWIRRLEVLSLMHSLERIEGLAAGAAKRLGAPGLKETT